LNAQPKKNVLSFLFGKKPAAKAEEAKPVVEESKKEEETAPAVADTEETTPVVAEEAKKEEEQPAAVSPAAEPVTGSLESVKSTEEEAAPSKPAKRGIFTFGRTAGKNAATATTTEETKPAEKKRGVNLFAGLSKPKKAAAPAEESKKEEEIKVEEVKSEEVKSEEAAPVTVEASESKAVEVVGH
jgi:hypothetical protein